MKGGYKVFWTNHALFELNEILTYLEENWTHRELQKFANEVDHTIQLISKNPRIFQSSTVKPDIRKAVILTYNSMYYRINKNTIEILSLFSNRKNPNRNSFQ